MAANPPSLDRHDAWEGHDDGWSVMLEEMADSVWNVSVKFVAYRQRCINLALAVRRPTRLEDLPVHFAPRLAHLVQAKEGSACERSMLLGSRSNPTIYHSNAN